MAHGGMRPLASAPLAAPLPRRSEAEPFRNSRSHGRATVVLWSVSAFLLQTPGGDPVASADVRSTPHASVRGEVLPPEATERGNGDRSLIDRSPFLGAKRAQQSCSV